MDRQSVAYYDEHAVEFFEGTHGLDMSALFYGVTVGLRPPKVKPEAT